MVCEFGRAIPRKRPENKAHLSQNDAGGSISNPKVPDQQRHRLLLSDTAFSGSVLHLAGDEQGRPPQGRDLLRRERDRRVGHADDHLDLSLAITVGLGRAIAWPRYFG
jgi:hypothetical protein